MFYTYLWLREDGTPYYVGKGRRERGFVSGRHNVSRPKSRARVIIQHWESEVEAFEKEKWYISLFGRKDNKTGILRNLTDGGEGASGAIQSEESKRKKSETLEGHLVTEETLRKMSEARKGKPNPKRRGIKHSKESLEKISLSLKGRTAWNVGKPWSYEARIKMSNSHKGKPTWNKGLKGARRSEETLRKMSDAQWQRRRIFIL